MHILGNYYKSDAVLVTVMITEKGRFCSQGDSEDSLTVEIRAIQYSTKIRERNRRTGLKVRLGF